MEGKASGGGYIPRGLLGKDGVHRGVLQSIVLREGEEKGAGMVGTEQQSWLGCQDEELARHPKGNREPRQNLEQEKGLHERGRAWNASPDSPDRGPPASSPSTPSRNNLVRAFSGPQTFKRHSFANPGEYLGPQPVYQRVFLQSFPQVASVSSSLIYIMEKAMAPHSSTLAWKIPWTEEPGRLQSMGSLKVGHD